MRRFEHPMHKTLADHAEFISNGSFQGRLYRIDWYPGAVLTSEPKDKVHGEVYKLKDPIKTLEILDEFEAFDPRNLEGSEFIRKTVQVVTENNDPIDCEVYLFNHSIERAKWIEKGKFLSL